MSKMKVDIWSDVMCPFCYIGKRRFEQALEKFPNSDNIEVVWHSFQLDPTLKAEEGLSTVDYLATRKGMPRAQAEAAQQHVTQMAAEAGLTYKMDQAVLANTFDAHRLGHLAKERGEGDAIEEALFKAYFTEGKDLGDADVLAGLGEQVGIPSEEVKAMLATSAYQDAVNKDIQIARQMGISGVPFFVLDGKYGVSGAQPPETFLSALTQAWNEHKPDALTTLAEGDACDVDGKNC